VPRRFNVGITSVHAFGHLGFGYAILTDANDLVVVKQLSRGRDITRG